jgi:hypothetical protein
VQPRLLDVNGVQLDLQQFEDVGVPQRLERQDLGAELQEGALDGLFRRVLGGLGV